MSSAEVRGLVEPFTHARGGFSELVNGVQPAAGTDFTLGIPGQYETRPLSVSCRLVTDANAGNREIVCQYLDGDGNVFLTHGAATVVAANSTADYYFGHQFTEDTFTVDSSALAPLSDVFLEPGWSIRLHIVGVKAGDQLSRIRLNLERFETGRRGYEEGVHPRALRRRRG